MTKATPSEVLLYTRHGCHLCDAARKLLESYGLGVVEVDIDGDEQLRAKYDHCVPVVMLDGKLRFRGRVDEMLLRRLLRGRK